MDRVSRYIWIFLTESKAPPISIARKVLEKFRCANLHRTVRTDQGGEPELSEQFQEIVVDVNFVLEVTESNASAQNAIAESQNKYLINMMRCILHVADLGPEYWPFGLRHVVYIKNRPHMKQ